MFNRPQENKALQLPKEGLLRVIPRHRSTSKVEVLIESGRVTVRSPMAMLKSCILISRGMKNNCLEPHVHGKKLHFDSEGYEKVMAWSPVPIVKSCIFI